MAAVVDIHVCNGCGDCVDICPVDAISMQSHLACIDEETCIDCGACVDACPVNAITDLVAH